MRDINSVQDFPKGVWHGNLPCIGNAFCQENVVMFPVVEVVSIGALFAGDYLQFVFRLGDFLSKCCLPPPRKVILSPTLGIYFRAREVIQFTDSHCYARRLVTPASLL